VKTPAGALPKIDGELQELGFVLSVPAVAHYSRGYGGVAMPVRNGVPFFHNHHEAIVAFSFVIVLTAMYLNRSTFIAFLGRDAERDLLQMRVETCK